jgi:hypothetical protein
MSAQCAGGAAALHTDFDHTKRAIQRCMGVIVSVMEGTRFVFAPLSHLHPRRGTPYTAADMAHITLPAGCILVSRDGWGGHSGGGGGMWTA